jgi:hypothetical protein
MRAAPKAQGVKVQFIGLFGKFLTYFVPQKYLLLTCLQKISPIKKPALSGLFYNMVHPGGFEPPTARFVAEYSIQLSYGCINF